MLLVISFISYALCFLLLAALALHDLKNYILPNKMNAALALAFGGFHISTKWHFITPVDALLGILVGAGLLLAIRFVANRIYQADTLGLGDVKLMAAAGFGLGFPDILLALSLGAGLGLVHGLIMASRLRKENAPVTLDKINVPAGVGLCLGIAIIMMSQFGFWWRSYG